MCLFPLIYAKIAPNNTYSSMRFALITVTVVLIIIAFWLIFSLIKNILRTRKFSDSNKIALIAIISSVLIACFTALFSSKVDTGPTATPTMRSFLLVLLYFVGTILLLYAVVKAVIKRTFTIDQALSLFGSILIIITTLNSSPSNNNPSVEPDTRTKPTISSAFTPFPSMLISNPTPLPTEESALYKADWSSGMNGWTGSSEWKVVNGQLVSDGTISDYPATGHDAVMAPYQPSTANYAIEAKIQIINSLNKCRFGIRGRVQAGDSFLTGYSIGVDTEQGGILIGSFPSHSFDWLAKLASKIYTPDLAWHTYRAAFKDNQISLFIDGNDVLQVTDNTYVNSGQIGLGNSTCQINVSSFKVIQL